MKVFISSDIEGTAGIVDWQQVIGPGPEYELGRRLLLGEVNAAVEGAIAGGATEIVVNDAHWTMHNFPPAELAGRASLISGKHKPLYMMEGLDGSFDAVMFVSYHASIGAERAVLSHTYNPFAISEVLLNGQVTGESGVNALVALHFGVPVALVTGDEQTAEETQRFLPGVECAVVKRSISRFAAHSLHPEAACEAIREAATRALGRAASLPPPAIDLPARLDVNFLTADMAELATAVAGVDRADTRAVTIESADALELYRTFVAVVTITATLVERPST